MDIIDAERLIRQGVEWKSRSSWADLGCGSGLFTAALANILRGSRSVIYAVDTNSESLRAVDVSVPDIVLNKINANFVEDLSWMPMLDGILMANSLHYVKDKKKFIQQIRSRLDTSGCIIIVEYDTDRPNPWVPFPISRQQLNQLITPLGFTSQLLEEQPSIYDNGNLYSSLIQATV